MDERIQTDVGPPAVIARVRVTLTRDDESLPRLVSNLRRRLWSIVELQFRRGTRTDEVLVVASKYHGRPDQLAATLERDRRVIRVVSA